MTDIRIGRISVGFILTTRFRALTAMVLRASIMDSLVAGMDPSTCSITLTRVLSPSSDQSCPKQEWQTDEHAQTQTAQSPTTSSGMNLPVRTSDSLVPKTPKTMVGKLF